MNADSISVLIVISLGLFAGTAAGLILGFLMKLQKKTLAEMTRRQILLNAALIVACSAACTAGIFWYAFVR